MQNRFSKQLASLHGIRAIRAIFRDHPFHSPRMKLIRIHFGGVLFDAQPHPLPNGISKIWEFFSAKKTFRLLRSWNDSPGKSLPQTWAFKTTKAVSYIMSESVFGTACTRVSWPWLVCNLFSVRGTCKWLSPNSMLQDFGAVPLLTLCDSESLDIL